MNGRKILQERLHKRLVNLSEMQGLKSAGLYRHSRYLRKRQKGSMEKAFLLAARGSENRIAFTIRVPVGPICAISPFNFPLNLAAHKVGPAIAAGNSVVLKPAELTPLTAVN